MATKVDVYECHNTSCTLGSRKDPGRFSGGASQELVTTITGDPYAKSGDGVCPACGEVGKKAGTDTLADDSKDPNQAAHDEIAARVANPDDKLTMAGAQDALNSLVWGDAEETNGGNK